MTGFPLWSANGSKAGELQLSQREQSEPGVCGHGVQPHGSLLARDAQERREAAVVGVASGRCG